jgi:hypothetical protein
MAAPSRDFSETIVSFFVVTTAIAALWLSYRQLDISREHNRLSTQAFLEIQPDTDESDDSSDTDSDEERGIFVENKGLGPALIKSVTYFFDGGQLSPPTTGDRLVEIGEFAKKLGLIKFVTTDEDEIAPGKYFKEGKRVELLTAEPQHIKDPAKWTAFVTNRFGVAIRYCSIYDVCRTACRNTSADFMAQNC